MIVLFCQKPDSSKQNKRKEGRCQLIITSSDSAECFHFVKKALHYVSLLIGAEITEPRINKVALRWNGIHCSLSSNISTDLFRSISFICKDIASSYFYSGQ